MTTWAEFETMCETWKNLGKEVYEVERRGLLAFYEGERMVEFFKIDRNTKTIFRHESLGEDLKWHIN